MTGQMALPSSVTGAQYELVVYDEYQSGTTPVWWVETGVNKITSAGTSVVYDTQWQGYFVASSYAGGMALGQAQTFQAGGEVFDEAAPGDGWAVKMGSGVDPFDGYPTAAYVYNVYAGDLYSTIGPVTVPTSYNFSSTTAAGSSSWNNWFYIGDYGQHFIWSSFTTPGATAPTIWAPSTRSTVGYNAITVAPMYVYDSTIQESVLHIFVLTTTANGNNHAVEEYNSLTNTWSSVLNSSGAAFYVWGITSDASNGAFWGWTHFSGTEGGAIWTNDQISGGIEEQTGWPGFSNIAAPGPLDIFATAISSGYSSDTAYNYMPGNHWQYEGVTGVQVTADTINGAIYVLSSSGTIVEDEGGDSYYITDNQCSSGTKTFVQIAAKNGTIYGLDSGGTVWWLTPSVNNCWNEITQKTAFAYSIACDNGSTTGVWATDGAGGLWTAE